jgi:predicted nuclease of predicted toxin-antitoxin system
MNFLSDQDVYASTVRFLRDLGHDVVPAAQIGLAQAADEDLLMTAHEQNRILVTMDRDYGNLVFVKALGAGIIYLRMLPSAQNTVHKELEHVLKAYTEEELRKSFVVIEAGGHRVRRVLIDK